MAPLSSVIEQKLNRLREILAETGRLCIAFSGGVDSTLLLKVAAETRGIDIISIIAEGPMIPESELKESIALAESLKVKLIALPVNIFELPEFYNNSPMRCYYCKKHIFSRLKEEAAENGYMVLADGTNMDDLNSDRPGLKALEELSVMSPLAGAGLSKQEIRLLSDFYGLPTAGKPSMACLATRIPHGTVITPEALKTVEAGEEILKGLNLSQYRLRLKGSRAKIECGPCDFSIIIRNRKYLVNALKDLGITGLSLDLEAYGESTCNNSAEQTECPERRKS